jgi:F-type H+-transporting ATPase subunit delta
VKSSAQVRRNARQLLRLCLVNGTLEENRVRLAVQHILGSKRRGSLILLSHFQRFLVLHRAAHTAEVESAEPLPPDLRARVESQLSNMYGSGISTSFVQNPALIAGMRVKIGSDVYDGSVRAGLVALERSF